MWRRALVLLLVLAIVFAIAAIPFAQRYRMPAPSVAGVYASFVCLLALAVVPGTSGGSREWVRARIPTGASSAVVIAILCLPYLLYAAGTGDFRLSALLRLALLAAILWAVYVVRPVADVGRFCWQDLAVAVMLIAALLGHQLVGIWNVPVNLDFLSRLYLIALCSWIWTFVRQVPQLGYEFTFRARSFAIAAIHFAGFAVIAIPLGLALGFTAWNPRWHGAVSFGLSFLEIFLFVALLEEMFFRGFLQSLLSHNFKTERGAQVLVACVFGLFHILHAPFPNWRYVVLATIAGFFYGAAYIRSGNLIAPALTHAAVDTVWRTFFTKG